MKIFDREEAKAYLDGLPEFGAFKCVDSHSQFQNAILRAKKEDDQTIFVFIKGKRRYGYRYNINTFLDEYKVLNISVSDPTESWHRRLRKAIKLLQSSGLWTDLIPRFENLLTMTWDDLIEIRSLYWDRRNHSAEENNAAFTPYAEKYPWAFETSSDGEISPIWDLMNEVTECKLKSMYFGKYRNARIKEEIRVAIENKQKYGQYRLETSYDVTFEYDPEQAKAWYSEEYRGCGNGHYYLALNHSTALFCEDD